MRHWPNKEGKAVLAEVASSIAGALVVASENYGQKCTQVVGHNFIFCI